MLVKAFLVATGIKLLLTPAYKSTDAEVHRNWLAITYSLPLDKWYVDNTSEWTLDYPPLFAWFQYVLSLIAQFFDKEMLVVTNLNYDSPVAKNFMRFSVMLADVFLLFGIKEIHDYFRRNPLRKSSRMKLMWGSPSTVFNFLVLTNMGLFIVDHIHFQYNGILFGILLLSIGKILKKEYLWGAFWFAVLLNMKHIFLYMAPAYGIYLLKNYCLESHLRPNQQPFMAEKPAIDVRFNLSRFLIRLAKLGAVVLFVTAVSFGPFIYIGQTTQVLSRLFPFKRGLCHAYWAPNAWALYNTLDKLLIRFFLFTEMADRGFLGYLILYVTKGKMTSGVLENYEHAVLPTISPLITATLVLLSILPCLVKLWTNPGNPFHFVRAIILCTLCSFLFGWHVHEKAILMVIIPLSIMAVFLQKEAEVYTILSIAGHYSLLPLIFTPHEFILKALLMFFSSFYIISALTELFQVRRGHGGFIYILNIKENLYLAGLICVFFYEYVFHMYLGHHVKYPFLPIMVTSCYCAIGIIYCTVKYYYSFLIMQESQHKRHYF